MLVQTTSPMDLTVVFKITEKQLVTILLRNESWAVLQYFHGI